MRYIILLLGIFITINSSLADDLTSVTSFTSKDGFELELRLDLMEDKESLTYKNHFAGISDDDSQGIVLRPTFVKKKGKWVYSYVLVGMIGIGSCHENSTALILFEDGSKATVSQFGDFSCDTYLGFDIGEKLAKLARQSPIKAVRAKNGRSYESFTYMPKNDDERNFFIRVFNAVDELNNKEQI